MPIGAYPGHYSNIVHHRLLYFTFFCGIYINQLWVNYMYVVSLQINQVPEYEILHVCSVLLLFLVWRQWNVQLHVQ